MLRIDAVTDREDGVEVEVFDVSNYVPTTFSLNCCSFCNSCRPKQFLRFEDVIQVPGDYGFVAREQLCDLVQREPRAISSCRLLVDALKSQDDRLAGFVLSWAAVEMTVNKFSAELDLKQLPSIVPLPFAELAARLNANVEARDRKVHTFLERLQALLMFLGVDAWESTVASVAEIAADYRQPLYHQGQFDEPGLPVERTVQIARELLLQVTGRFA